MTCCAFPPPSQEPRYPLHPDILGLLEDWERRFPGVGISLAEEITSGDWSKVGEGGSLDLPEFTPSDALDLAVEQLEELLVKSQALALVRTGPWYIRFGLVKPAATLGKEAASQLIAMKEQAQTLRERLVKETATTFPKKAIYWTAAPVRPEAGDGLGGRPFLHPGPPPG